MLGLIKKLGNTPLFIVYEKKAKMFYLDMTNQ